MQKRGMRQEVALKRRIWMPLPDRDFDVTEVAVPWKLLTEAGYEVVFATEFGATPACDPLLIDGVVFGQLGAEPEPVAFYREMEWTAAFRRPVAWDSIAPDDYDALHLAGGHAPGMKQYLGSARLREKVAGFWKLDRPVSAICHGVLILARTVEPETGRSLLHGRRTTCLPKYMERAAWYLTAWKLGRYYRTYPEYVEDEVKAALADPGQFARGPLTLATRGTRDDDGPAFVVEDDRYVSARWPGDSYLIARKLIGLLGRPAG
jgi:putative intracellular protease/amidase